jgi:hypothetical protein
MKIYRASNLLKIFSDDFPTINPHLAGGTLVMHGQRNFMIVMDVDANDMERLVNYIGVGITKFLDLDGKTGTYEYGGVVIKYESD